MGKDKKSSKKDEARSEALRKDIDFIEHTWEDEKMFEHFGIKSLEEGLTSAQVQANRAKYGENRLTPPKTTPWYIKYLLQYTNFFAMLLIAGGLLCFIAYAVEDSANPGQADQTNLWLGVVLISVVIITATFSYVQEASSDAIMEGFKNMIPKKCKAIRDGTVNIIDAWELVPGDVVQMGDGDQIPADICVKKSTDFKVDNSSLTGESEPQDRSRELARDSNGQLITQPLEATNLCFYTTIVNSGAATGVVIGTGDRTVMGQIAGLATETSNEATPINIEIKKFIMLISALAITIGLIFFIIGFILGTDPISNVVFAIGIIVANVPEGLLATVTVSLALTAKRMHQKNVLVKNLEAVETLGSTTVIASDKTGTLTQNRMTVQHAWYDDCVVKTPSCKNHPQFSAVMKAADPSTVVDTKAATFQRLMECAVLCNNSEFVLKDPMDENAPTLNLQAELGKPDFNLLSLNCTGDASESGLIKFTQMIDDYAVKRKACEKIFEIKFNSTNKWQMSIHKAQDPNSTTPNLYLKGAPERVLKMCKKIMIQGVEHDLTPEWEAKYTEAYEGLGGMGERVLGFAYKKMEGYDYNYKFVSKPERNFEMEDLTFVGLFSLIDPPREGVPEAVAKCKRARIKVFMVTGDHPITAQAIAKQVGIIDQDKWDAGKATVVKGDDIRDWMEIEDVDERTAKWDEALSHEQIVFARVSPAHKLLIVENNQRRGEVVAVTGDGVNDAPALKKGDIGVAMGIAGKDVSKEAADMILMDDNFASIVNGVEEGRLIFDNLKKSIAYTLTSNIPEIGPFLVYITVGLPLPLSTVLILCVDLGTDMVPAISLAYEEKESDIMDRPPRNAATDRLVNRRLISFAYLQIGVMQALAGFYTYFMVLNDYGYAPRILLQKGLSWDLGSLMCTLDDTGHPLNCGYGCETKQALSQDYTPCNEGCEIPTPGFHNPFSEMTAAGFRGIPYDTLGSEPSFDTSPAVEGVCGRSCAWYEANKANPAVMGTSLLTDADVLTFDAACTGADAPYLGFPWMPESDDNRTRVEAVRVVAPEGSFYWWNGQKQYFPNPGYQSNALKYAQTAYFIAIIVVQWADLLIAKTRKLSIFEQGMRNGFMNFGLCFETVLGVLLVYLPFLNVAFGTRPLYILHWFPAVPWSILIFVYDEVRKSIIRANPGGWMDDMTYW
eukprot:scaffold186521_cov43-Prasinocladus_malaysianus.AAC.1